jgi:hypothetical protein
LCLSSLTGVPQRHGYLCRAAAGRRFIEFAGLYNATLTARNELSVDDASRQQPGGAIMRQPNAPIIDQDNVLDVFADGVAAVTQFGAVTHLLFTARRQDTYEGRIERVIQLRLIVPTEQVRRIGRIVMSGRRPEVQRTEGDEKAEAIH